MIAIAMRFYYLHEENCFDRKIQEASHGPLQLLGYVLVVGKDAK